MRGRFATNETLLGRWWNQTSRASKETDVAAGYVCFLTPYLAKGKMYKTSGPLPYSAVSVLPKMEMDEHRADCKQIEERIAKLGKQLADKASLAT